MGYTRKTAGVACKILNILANDGAAPSLWISRKLKVTEPTVQRVLDKLEGRGLVGLSRIHSRGSYAIRGEGRTAAYRCAAKSKKGG